MVSVVVEIYILHYCVKVIFLRMVSSVMLRRVPLVRTDVSEDISASIIRVTRIGEVVTTLAVTSNRVSVASYS
jgi:hypothetical protein